MPIATTVEELGTGDYPGQLKIIQYGPAGKEERVPMRWLPSYATSGAWVMSKPRNTVTMRDGYPIHLTGVTDNVWGYLFHLKDSGNYLGTDPVRSYSWNPVAINHADSAFNAGLTLQENVLARWWTWDPGCVMQLATVFYPIDIGDEISTLISASAGDHLGTVIDSLPTVRQWSASGWHDSLVQSCAKQMLAPHLYAKHDTGEDSDNFLESILAQWRWVGVPE